MSGYPSKEKVQEVKQYVRQLIANDRRVEEIRQQQADLGKELEEKGEENRNLLRSIQAHLDSMDLSSTGNYGWMNRLVAFLAWYDDAVHGDRS